MKSIKILFFMSIVFSLSNCNDDNGPFTTIDAPSAARLEQLVYHYGKWEVNYKTLIYKDLITADTFKQHFYLDFQTNGFAEQTPLDASLKQDFYWNLSQDATEMVICKDIDPINSSAFLSCSTYKIINQTDSTQQWQRAYYLIQGADSTRYLIQWQLTRQ